MLVVQIVVVVANVAVTAVSEGEVVVAADDNMASLRLVLLVSRSDSLSLSKIMYASLSGSAGVILDVVFMTSDERLG